MTGAPADLTAWIRQLYTHPELLRMGHAQSGEDLNLGLGWIYYALGRLLRPRRALVIGSWRGFVPLVMARALAENAEPGQLDFIDPSLVDDFWKDPARSRAWFAGFGLANIRHHLSTTQDFIRSTAYGEIRDIGLFFVDGYHTAAQARIDYEAFADRLAPGAVVLFHDSLDLRTHSRLYGPGREYAVDVKDYMAELRQDPALELFDLPFGAGLTLLRRRA